VSEPQVDVDYRFLLANERTFLAWMRTALGLVAGGVALDQFVRVEQGESVIISIAVATILAGALVAVLGTFRWARMDAAMRAGRAVPASAALIVIGSLFATLAVVVAVILALS
jgi:putative membrane protein